MHIVFFFFFFLSSDNQYQAAAVAYIGIKRDTSAEGGRSELVLLTRHGRTAVREPDANLQRVDGKRLREVLHTSLELQREPHTDLQ